MPLCPRPGATPAEQAKFYESRAKAFTRAAKSDRNHYYEAMAVAGIAREKSLAIAAEIERRRGGTAI